jgi:hypothetical protein
MNSMLSVSLWFALVTVVPGLVTVAVLWLASVVVFGSSTSATARSFSFGDVTLAIALTTAVMVLTQTFGILLESKLLVPRRLLGSRRGEEKQLRGDVDPFADDAGRPVADTVNTYVMNPYEEYAALYLVLTSLRKDEDAHGHFQRVVAQFFLTVNSIVALAAGVVATGVLLYFAPDRVPEGLAYGLSLSAGIVALWFVAVNRFRLLGWGLWATRRRRVREREAADRLRAGRMRRFANRPR